jgi:hypothetical protein
VPADVRLRFNKLQERDIPSVTSSDENDNDEDSDMNDEDDNGASTEQVSNNWYPWFSRTVVI